ncbi:hypothetical protein [Vreelandella zhanjiangensis]|uniref:hypothetical protein n=1 Tax=Vreelandella zhanjiangensis TaxID=1121960 RepID=UPI0003A9FF48|nr:hypothetical protein [Halomonas zhanjiangensis]
MEAFLLPPYDNHSRNLLWSPFQSEEHTTNIEASLGKIVKMDYWASPFPEGDGVTFKPNKQKSEDEIISDFKECFDWLDVMKASHKEAINRLALIDAEILIDCIITVPLQQIRIETSCQIADNYKYLANEMNDTITIPRIADFNSEQIEFDLKIKFGDLLKLNGSSLEHDDYVINLCLDHAERGMDLIRLRYSSFDRPEFTPNPAGQLTSGFYEVKITPNTSKRLPIKPKVYGGLSKSLSASNNWLGPEVSDHFNFNDYKLSEVLLGNEVHELGDLLIGSLRNCRQAFYTIGDESKFLSLIFSIDGLGAPDQDWNGWKHRTYITALACNENPSKFREILESYDYLYTDIRNKLVHSGKSFYELGQDNGNNSCEKLWTIYKDIVNLILNKDFTTISELHLYAELTLKQPSFINEISTVVNKVDSTRVTKSGQPKKIKLPKW